jgi:hypothetical protein
MSSRFQLAGPWPVGQYAIPGGTVLERDNFTWNGIALPWPPPIDSIALNQSAYNDLIAAYPQHHHRIMTRHDAGIVRHGDPQQKELKS